MNKKKHFCRICKSNKFDKGRAFDGRRAYRCKNCGHIHTLGMQGRNKRFSEQRYGYQFYNSKGVGHVA